LRYRERIGTARIVIRLDREQAVDVSGPEMSVAQRQSNSIELNRQGGHVRQFSHGRFTDTDNRAFCLRINHGFRGLTPPRCVTNKK
jgi:hypothetical protein